MSNESTNHSEENVTYDDKRNRFNKNWGHGYRKT